MNKRGRKLFCRHLLRDEGWQSNQQVSLDEDGVILSLEPGDPRKSDLVLEGWVIPGLPNLHSHAFQRLLAGRTGYRGNTSDSFWTWRESMYELVDRLDPDRLEAVTAYCYMELLKG